MNRIEGVRPNEEYFRRNTGEWNWIARFNIVSWADLWGSPIRFTHKLRVTALIFSQFILGACSMWTRVAFDESGRILHSLRLAKCGIPFYRSEKKFTLDENGHDLKLWGDEYYWPALNTPISFDEKQGKVDSSTTEASYQMPLFGLAFSCKTFLGKGQGTIHLDAGWMRAEFKLTEEYLRILQARF